MMSDRPRTILHGDFRWNNCVVDTSGNVGIIDFSGNNIGDPWYEFGGLLWALEYSTEDIKKHIFNAERMINIFGKNFELDIPLFRKQDQ